MHIPTGRKHHFMRKPCFICFTLCLLSRCFMMVWFMFSIYALLFSSHHAYVLDMYTSLCHCTLLVACLDDHLLSYMIIVVISIWLFCFFIKLLICFTSYLLDCIFTCYIILVILLLVLLVLSWGSNVFCVSVSSYKYTCSKFIIGFRFRCEWVLPLFPNSCLSLEYVIGCFVTE